MGRVISVGVGAWISRLGATDARKIEWVWERERERGEAAKERRRQTDRHGKLDTEIDTITLINSIKK